MATETIRSQARMTSTQVMRLRALARLVDELDQKLDQVEFLKDDITDQRKYDEVVELAQNAQAALCRIRDSLAKHGGEPIAKGYK